MINIVSALLYRLLRSKSFYICLALAIILPILLFAFVSALFSFAESMLGQELGLLIDPLAIVASQSRLDSDVVLLLVLTVSIFVSAEFRQGLIRNTIIANKSRMQIFWAYLITLGLIVFVFGTVNMLVNSVFSVLILGYNTEYTVGYFIGACFAYYGVHLLMLFFVAIFTAFMCVLFKSNSMSIALPLLVFALVLPLLSSIVGFGATLPIDTTGLSWIPLMNLMLITDKLDGVLLAKCVGWLVIFTAGLAVGMAFYMRKTDIK